MNGWFDSPIESFKQAYQQIVAKWQDAMDALDTAYSEFQSNFDYAQQDADLAQKWNDLDGKVSLLQGTIQGVSDAMDSIKSFFTSIGSSIGMSGSSAAMAGMGVLPAIPWALVSLITAGVAGVWLIINALRAFNVEVENKKIAEQNIINSQEGKPIIPYIDLADNQGGLFSSLPDTAKWVAIGIIGFFALRALESRR